MGTGQTIHAPQLRGVETVDIQEFQRLCFSVFYSVKIQNQLLGCAGWFCCLREVYWTPKMLDYNRSKYEGGVPVEKFRKALNIISIISSIITLIVAIKALCMKNDAVEVTEE